jgi:hypothetical protein
MRGRGLNCFHIRINLEGQRCRRASPAVLHFENVLINIKTINPLKLPDGADKIALILVLMVAAVGSDPARVVSAIAESLRNRIITLLTSKFVDENLSKKKGPGTPAL